MRDPKDTLLLLDRLESLGFDDDAFAALHHFRNAGRADKIASHRRYCEKTDRFGADGENERVQRRLRLVLSAYLLAGFESGRSDVFRALAEAAFAEVSTKADETSTS
jgi:hypothetical protein